MTWQRGSASPNDVVSTLRCGDDFSPSGRSEGARLFGAPHVPLVYLLVYSTAASGILLTVYIIATFHIDCPDVHLSLCPSGFEVRIAFCFTICYYIMNPNVIISLPAGVGLEACTATAKPCFILLRLFPPYIGHS